MKKLILLIGGATLIAGFGVALFLKESRRPAASVRAPVRLAGFGSDLATPQEQALYRSQAKELRSRVLAQERQAHPNIPAHQILAELDWLIASTRDRVRIREGLAALSAALEDPRDFSAVDTPSETDGSWGRWCTEWSFKLRASYEPIVALAGRQQLPPHPLRLLDRINSPERLTAYLDSLLMSDLAADGVDRRQELVMVVGDLGRMILRGQPANYPFHPKLKAAFTEWLFKTARNPASGYWGERYWEGGKVRQVDDFPFTLTLVRNLKGNVSEWDRMIGTALASASLGGAAAPARRYSNRDNLDMLRFFRLGWSRVTPALQAALRSEIDRRLSWCLADSLQPDGSFAVVPGDSSVETGVRNGAAFLSEAGYFNRSRRFWTDREFPRAEEDRARITRFIGSQLAGAHEGGAGYRAALAQIAPNPADHVRVIEDVAYLAPGRSEKLDLYLPPHQAQDPAVPAVIWAHGNQGDKGDDRERNVCETLSAAGYVCASINYGPWDGSRYRPFSSFERNVGDGKNAVRFLRLHAAEYHVDPDRIGFFGGSAGANISLLVGFTDGLAEFEPSEPYPGVSSAVRVIGDFYGWAGAQDDRRPRSWSEWILVHLFAAQLRMYSAVTHITPASPPVFIAHGRDDALQDFAESVALEHVLSQKGVPHDFVALDKVGHGFDLAAWSGQPLPVDLRARVLAFLNRYLGPPIPISSSVGG